MKKQTPNDFNFWLPIDFMKSDAAEYPRGDDRRYENMIFEGIASDDSKDYQGDSMEPNGFVIDYFLKHGLFNLDHLTVRAKELKSRFWIGEPLDGKIVDNKFWVKGKLWSESPEARAFWDKCIEMRESGSTRKPGMSIEGKALERDPKNEKHITKKGIQSQDFIPTGDLLKSQLKRDVMFEQVIGNKRIVIDSKFRIIQEGI